MEEQLKLDVMKDEPIDVDWLLKYPPTRVGPDILGTKFYSVAIPGDGFAMVIEDVDRWIDREIVEMDVRRPVDLGPVLVSWGVLAIAPSWNRVSEAIIAHACGELDQTCGCGCDLNSRDYPRAEARIESRVLLGDGIHLLISTYMVGLHTEVKLARDVEITPKYGCIE